MKRMIRPISSIEVRNMTLRMKCREKFIAIILLMKMM